MRFERDIGWRAALCRRRRCRISRLVLGQRRRQSAALHTRVRRVPRSVVVMFLVVISPLVAVSAETLDDSGWALAVPGYSFSFPRDYGPHQNFRTEWWYFTGNLKAKDGKEFGYEVAFFRYGYRPPDKRAQSRFVMNDLKFAHFAVTDIGTGRFRFDSRTSRGAYGEAGFGDAERLAWINGWEASFDGSFRLKADAKEYQVDLVLAPEKPPVLQGENGLSQKADGVGHASYYYSITRLATSGMLKIDGESYQIGGSSWFDREWATNQLGPDQTGWDWFAIQLSDGSDLMLYQMRMKNGEIDPHSNGTWIRPDGTKEAVSKDDFQLQPEAFWEGSVSKARYPVQWRLRIPKLGLDLQVTTPVKDQELRVGVTYWEGCIRLAGELAGKPASGVGYMELTGYAGESLR
jgi:predicted secreted hydrolase